MNIIRVLQTWGVPSLAHLLGGLYVALLPRMQPDFTLTLRHVLVALVVLVVLYLVFIYHPGGEEWDGTAQDRGGPK
jgi:hypothetical protein